MDPFKHNHLNVLDAFLNRVVWLWPGYFYYSQTPHQLQLLLSFPWCSKCTTPAKCSIQQKREHLIWCVLNIRNSQNRVFSHSPMQFIVIMQVQFTLNLTINFNSQIKSVPRIAISFQLECLVEMWFYERFNLVFADYASRHITGTCCP